MPPVGGFPCSWEENLVEGLYINRYRSPRRSWKMKLGRGTSGIPWCHRHGWVDGSLHCRTKICPITLRKRFHLPNALPVPNCTEWFGTHSIWHRHYWPLCPSLVLMYLQSSLLSLTISIFHIEKLQLPEFDQMLIMAVVNEKKVSWRSQMILTFRLEDLLSAAVRQHRQRLPLSLQQCFIDAAATDTVGLHNEFRMDSLHTIHTHTH